MRRGTGTRAVVVGAGVAGLATAALLARDGYDVQVLEQRAEVGGRAGTWDCAGFRFDTGPSWYLMPEVFEHFFALLGTSADAELDLVRLDPAYRAWFASGAEPLELHSDADRSVELFEAVEPGAGARLRRYLESARITTEVALEHLLYSTFQSLPRLLSPALLRRAGRLLPLVLQSLDGYVAHRFRDERLRRVLGYPAVFLGTAPDRAPALYHLMSHADLADGVLYPRGGFGTLVDALRRLAEREGASVRTGARVVGILTTTAPTPQVSGVQVVDDDGHEHVVDADVVVGAGDLHHLETALLPPDLRTYPERWWANRDPGPGAVLVHLGVRGRVPELTHHTLVFAADWRANVDAVFGPGRRVPDEASMYVCAPSRTDPTVAPPDSENLFLLVPVPADVTLGGGGDPVVEQVADAAIDLLARVVGIPDLAERVVVRRTVGPADFARDLSSWSGGALGPAHVLRQSAWWRGRNASSKVQGLLYAGGSTIPGVGLPMCLISAELAVKRLRGDRSSGPLPAPLAPTRPAPVRGSR
ncbi:phytoene desaturase [Cellulomonas chitinilytica]|uniref:Phytoene desaturase n=1 Tax=Cellulomonas chitinilytica TaxID=398759 RepID=A0A919P223_9CELL|nr:phytoene desaturase family protein [Cellulomonas chitinilytica]GIG20458.1 phytoene desaturase [Cellulomonas chitinilytica]